MPESNAKRYWKEKAERLERERYFSREVIQRLVSAQRRANASTQVTGVRLSRELRAWAERRAVATGHDLSSYIRSRGRGGQGPVKLVERSQHPV